jgi:SAM-dependent methyltransferase
MAAVMETVNCPLCAGAHHRELLVAGPRRIVRCRDCGLVFRNPRPTASASTEEFASGRAEVPEEPWLGERRRAGFERFLDAWPAPPGRVLDVGCGGGWFLKAATDRGWTAVGVDLSPLAVERARRMFGVDARVGGIDRADLRDATFDLVTLWNVLELQPDPLGFLRAVGGFVRSGGALYVRTQNYPFQRTAFEVTRLARRAGLAAWLDARPHLASIFNATSFSNRTIRLLLARAGLRVVRVAPSPPSPGDPYRAIGEREWPLAAVKAGARVVARVAYLASGGRVVAGASLEALARRP